MGLISYTNIEEQTPATANGLNQRFGDIIDEVNGNLDSANLKAQAVTTAKIADGAVTSAKLGFTKYIDDNGWLITDLGLVKLATKTRTFKTLQNAAGSTAFITFDNGMDTNPVGFDSNSAYNMNWSFWGDYDSGRYVFGVESTGSTKPQPNTRVVQYTALPPVQVRNYNMEVWVVF